jgi:hypothetical protein
MNIFTYTYVQVLQLRELLKILDVHYCGQSLDWLEGYLSERAVNYDRIKAAAKTTEEI